MIIGKSLTALGGGGLKPEIIVTAKAGALLNLHYKGSSIILKSYQLGADETQHTFVVDVSETAYVVEDATNGKSVEVLVDAVAVFPSKIPYTTYLYKDGDECIDVTGGWIRITSGYSYNNASFAPNGTYNQFIKGSDRMSLTSYYIYSTLVSTSKAIDFTGYTTIHVEYELEGPSLKISTPERSDLTNPLYPLAFGEDGSADISISGEAYPYFISYSDHYVDVKKVWLE